MGLRMAKPRLEFIPQMQIEANYQYEVLAPRETLLPLEWFAVRTRPRHERVAKTNLEHFGIETFLPLSAQVRTWSDRRKVIEFPLFPGYLFIRTPGSARARLRVFQAQGVLGFVGTRRDASPIPDFQIETIRSVLRAQIECHPHEYLTVGQRVRIHSGSLEGVEGILVRVANDRSLIVSVDLIQRSVAVRLEGYEVEPV